MLRIKALITKFWKWFVVGGIVLAAGVGIDEAVVVDEVTDLYLLEERKASIIDSSIEDGQVRYIYMTDEVVTGDYLFDKNDVGVGRITRDGDKEVVIFDRQFVKRNENGEIIRIKEGVVPLEVWEESQKTTFGFIKRVFATEETFSTAGYTEFTVPTGVTSLDIACWGGGGGGRDDVADDAGGGGGGGAAFASSTEAVSPSAVIRLFIGAGGLENADGATTSASTTAPATLVEAAPGWAPKADLVIGAGGATASSTGDVTAAGGDGGLGLNSGDTSGGGGGAGGPHGAGVAGVNGNGTIGGDGGAGSAGSGGAGGQDQSGGDGLPGTDSAFGGGGGAGGDSGAGGGNGGTYGGGGGGGDICDAGTQCEGGDGACTITYTAAAGATPDLGDLIFFE